MKKGNFLIKLLPIVLLLIFIPSCETEPELTGGLLDVSGIKHTDCKAFKSLTSNKQDCVEYETIDGNYLKINRINVAFNCCIDEVNISSSIDQNQSITVTETEKCATPCDCICLYDLEYTLGPLEFGTYTLYIVEEYADTMSIEIDFSATSQGEYCEERNSYPWDNN